MVCVLSHAPSLKHAYSNPFCTFSSLVTGSFPLHSRDVSPVPSATSYAASCAARSMSDSSQALRGSAIFAGVFAV